MRDSPAAKGGIVIVQTRHESAYLAANMLGDPGERDLFVYLPPGYEESDRRYATAYSLHAFGEGAKDVVNPPTDGERWRPPIEDVLDPNRNVDQAFRATTLALVDGQVISGLLLREDGSGTRMNERLSNRVQPFAYNRIIDGDM